MEEWQITNPFGHLWLNMILLTQSTTVRLGNRTYRGVQVSKHFQISP